MANEIHTYNNVKKLTVMYVKFVILTPFSTYMKCHITRTSANGTIVGVNNTRMTALI